MIIYGVALLALCTLAGVSIGAELGSLLGLKANIGGVGFAMLLLVLITTWLLRYDRFKPLSASGIQFWSGIYIPVVVAISAKQNVFVAVKGGPAAVVAGVLGVTLSFAMIPYVNRIGFSGSTTGDKTCSTAPSQKTP
jgi:malonate transporter MadL subunit